MKKRLDKIDGLHVILYFFLWHTERWSSWLKAPVLKTGVGVSLPWVRISLSIFGEVPSKLRRGRFAKPLGRVNGAGVRSRFSANKPFQVFILKWLLLLILFWLLYYFCGQKKHPFFFIFFYADFANH